MEFKAAILHADGDMPVMIINGERKTPFYINPCDCAKLNPAQGDFCVESDRPKVLQVLSELHGAKAEWYLANGDLLSFRITTLFRARSTHMYHYTAEEMAVSGEEAIARVKRTLKWRDEATEAAWMAKYNISLLCMATCLNDLPAVTALLAQPDSSACLAMRCTKPWTKKEKALFSHRKEPFATYLIDEDFQNLDVLTAAVAFASLDVLKAVLAADPPMPKPAKKMNDVNPNFMMAVIDGKLEHYKLLVEKWPEIEIFRKPVMMGMTWAHAMGMMASGSQKDQQDNLAFFEAQGTDLGRRFMRMTPFLMSVINTEVDMSVIRSFVTDKGADVNDTIRLPRVVVHGVNFLAAVGSRTGKLMKTGLGPCLPYRPTPLHFACATGHIQLCKTLHELGADATKKDSKGRTPLELARTVHGKGSIVEKQLAAILLE